MSTTRQVICLLLGCWMFPIAAMARPEPLDDSNFGSSAPPVQQGLVAKFDFDGDVENSVESSVIGKRGNDTVFANGLDGQALSLMDNPTTILQLASDKLATGKSQDFSVQFWIRTVASNDKRFVVLSKKAFPDNSLASQKKAGWVFYVSHGTWAWNIGSGNRRLVYERDNGIHMPLNDGRWHQLTMTYDKDHATVRLYYDGINKVTYNIADSTGFDFSNHQPLVVGWNEAHQDSRANVLPAIAKGAEQLQELVNQFNGLGFREKINNDDLMRLVIDPKRLFDRKVRALRRADNPEDEDLLKSLDSADLGPIETLTRRLMRNPYTIHQAADFMKVAPLLKIYRVVDGQLHINEEIAEKYAIRERLDRPEFDIDNLAIWNRVLSSEEILNSYSNYFQPAVTVVQDRLSSLTVAAWNIHHGGIHETVEEDGWDSRLAIAEIIKRENIDIVLMQETYSSGDFIAAELGYYFATTVDWDYLNQGANISVISRYPVEEVDVPPSSAFMNVAAKINLSKTQTVYAMSNWYGMRDFPAVADHHQAKFENSNRIPVFFGGDFNAVPHTDGGNSPASRQLLEAGFVDAYRQMYPDVNENPGATHQGGSRIDQLYYKGAGLKNVKTHVLSTWPSRFPSDHFLIKCVFELGDAPNEKRAEAHLSK